MLKAILLTLVIGGLAAAAGVGIVSAALRPSLQALPKDGRRRYWLMVTCLIALAAFGGILVAIVTG